MRPSCCVITAVLLWSMASCSDPGSEGDSGLPARDGSPALGDQCVPGGERCDDGVDNDCDGETDERPCGDGDGTTRCPFGEEGVPTEGILLEQGSCRAPDLAACADASGVLTQGMDSVIRGSTEGHGNDHGSLQCEDHSVDTEDYVIWLRACDEGAYWFTAVETTPGLSIHRTGATEGLECTFFDRISCQSTLSCSGASGSYLLAGEEMAVFIDGENDFDGAFALRVRWAPTL